MKRLFLCALISGIFLSACSKDTSSNTNTVVSLADLFPKHNEISGWSLKGGSDAGWQAKNAAELQQAIDGGADLFTNHGFVEGAMQSYAGTVNTQADVELSIQLYDQQSAPDADAVFDDPNNTFANPIAPANPPSAKSQMRKDIFSHTMKFSKGKYYVLLTVMSADDKARDVLEVFAGNIAAKIN